MRHSVQGHVRLVQPWKKCNSRQSSWSLCLDACKCIICIPLCLHKVIRENGFFTPCCLRGCCEPKPLHSASISGHTWPTQIEFKIACSDTECSTLSQMCPQKGLSSNPQQTHCPHLESSQAHPQGSLQGGQPPLPHQVPSAI